MKVGAVESALVCCGVVLGEVVGDVGDTTSPEDDELDLGDFIL